MKTVLEDDEEIVEEHTVDLGAKAVKQSAKTPKQQLSKNASVREQLSARLEALMIDGHVDRDEVLKILTDSNSDEVLRQQVSALEAKFKFGIIDKPAQSTAAPEPEDTSKVLPLEEEEVEISQLDREDSIRALNNVVRVKQRPPPAKHIDGKMEIMELPSGYVFYDFDSVFVRPFNVGDIRRMSVAVRTLSQSLLMDIIAGCMTQDPRELTPNDFYYILYWQRQRSYPKTPMTVRWPSRYGVFDDTIVTRSMFREIRLEKNLKEKFMEFRTKGYDYPRMYDVESSDGLDWKSLVLDSEYDGYDWLYSRSQYFSATKDETIMQRMQRIETKEVSELEDVRDAMLMFKHGVEERLPVRLSAEKFNPKAAAEHLELKVESLMLLDTQSPEIMAMIADYQGEAKEIREKLEKGGDVRPREEFTTAPLDIRSFLSGL